MGVCRTYQERESLEHRDDGGGVPDVSRDDRIGTRQSLAVPRIRYSGVSDPCGLYTELGTQHQATYRPQRRSILMRRSCGMLAHPCTQAAADSSVLPSWCFVVVVGDEEPEEILYLLAGDGNVRSRVCFITYPW